MPPETPENEMTVVNDVLERIITTSGRGKKNGYNLKCLNDPCEEIVYVKRSVYDEAVTSPTIRTFCCSKACRYSEYVMDVLKEEYLKKYGVTNPFQLDSVKEKIKQTNLERYGVENPSQSKEVWEKIKTTWGNKYGSHPQQNEVVKQKTKSTRTARYKDRIGFCNKVPTEITNLNKYGHKYYFASEEGRQTLDNFIKRYGELEGKRKWKQYAELKKQTLYNFIERWGVEDGNARYLAWKDKCKHTLQNFINRHGEDRGPILYEEHYSNKLQKLLSGSKSGIEKKVYEHLRSLCIDVKSNFYIKSSDNSKYFYDIIVEGTNKIIEINGDFWHANPRFFTENQILHHPGRDISAKEVWSQDKKKIECAEQFGYEVLVIWEHEIRESFEDVIDKITNYIEEKT